MDNKRFGCKIKFLEHGLEKHKHNKFLPRETIIKTHSTLLNSPRPTNYILTSNDFYCRKNKYPKKRPYR